MLKFEQMVDEIYTLLNNSNTPTNIKKSDKLQLPKFNIKIESTRIIWSNANLFLSSINRNSEHFIDFLKYELNNNEINWMVNIDDGLIIHSRSYKIQNIHDIINKYIMIYVTCSSCKYFTTILTKYNSKKSHFECLNCGMQKYI